MKTVVRLAVAAFLLTCAMSTSSFADGGAPAPPCKPGMCPTVASPIK